MLYGRKCRAPICWDQVGERVIEGSDMIEVTNAKVTVAKEKLKEARTRQKSYADKHRRALEFQTGDHVFLKVSPARGVRLFGIKGKLSPRFIGPFEILDRVGLTWDIIKRVVGLGRVKDWAGKGLVMSLSTVTYTSVYTDSEPGRVYWGADEELSDGGPKHPPSPDYVPGSEHPPSPVELWTLSTLEKKPPTHK
uniref:Putative nucleotidyltransferase, ribonuclease H n=1 Tax=Tanacetum cinerariifolium TaxID=118510 RepID=A0A6L2LRC6_TANCI|nr:putative nucleotidyltransferase, ribonuclease H [Tanacetum cinerariifolium]